jgi:predicted amidohydrolase
MKVALIQFTGSDRPDDNLTRLTAMIRQAVAEGAGFVLTPEVSNCISTSRSHQQQVLRSEAEDAVLAGLRSLARDLEVWILAGSLALRSDDPDGRFANRSILIGPDGAIAARYDKIHMFDVAISETENYHESDGYRPGDTAVLADTPFGRIGMTVCYDLRFPHLYRALAQAGAQILTIPSAFTPLTGAAHWEILLRARAIETGCFVLAPAQTGSHPASAGRQRATWGHSLVVSPWGEVLASASRAPGIVHATLDLGAVAEARRRVPSLLNDRDFAPPA